VPTLLDLLGRTSLPPKNDGIRFTNRRFSEPALLRGATPLSWPGLYAILVYDPTCTPRPYRVVYFGQGSNLSERVTTSHEKYSKWCAAANGCANLYVAFHWLPGSNESQRLTAEAELIRDYRPQCNITFNPWGGLPRF